MADKIGALLAEKAGQLVTSGLTILLRNSPGIVRRWPSLLVSCGEERAYTGFGILCAKAIYPLQIDSNKRD